MVNTVDILRQLPHAAWVRAGHAYVVSDACYPVYSRAAALIKPDSILEIGAFDGLGLVSFIVGHEPRSVSWVDNQSYEPDSNQHCTENLHWLREAGYTRFVIGAQATSRDDERVAGHYDLVHIDGDHSYAGCMSDLVWAYTTCTPRVILVDDMTAPVWPAVRAAVQDFSRRNNLPYTICPTSMGWAVFDLAHCLPGGSIG